MDGARIAPGSSGTMAPRRGLTAPIRRGAAPVADRALDPLATSRRRRRPMRPARWAEGTRRLIAGAVVLAAVLAVVSGSTAASAAPTSLVAVTANDAQSDYLTMIRPADDALLRFYAETNVWQAGQPRVPLRESAKDLKAALVSLEVGLARADWADPNDPDIAAVLVADRRLIDDLGRFGYGDPASIGEWKVQVAKDIITLTIDVQTLQRDLGRPERDGVRSLDAS
jgi:hypothetical protein